MIEYRFRVGRYLVEASVPEPQRGQLLDLQFVWSPCVPKRLTRDERRQYQRGMAKAVAYLVDEIHQAAIAERVVLDPDPLRVTH